MASRVVGEFAGGTPPLACGYAGGASVRRLSEEAPIRVRGLVKTVGTGAGARRILDGVELDVARGEVVAITGSSGSGKTSLLHVLAGLEPADAGTVEVAGIDVVRASERMLSDLRRREVGLVFQFFHLLPELSAEANVLLPTRLAGVDGAARERAGELVDRLGLRPVAGSRPHELSGGELQRFAIARALVSDPSVLLADEPTANLDAEAERVVLGLVREAAAGGRAVVLVTHTEAAREVADRVLELRTGRLEP
jgi:ABC-type lipoprotein export system ATPase subunit